MHTFSPLKIVSIHVKKIKRCSNRNNRFWSPNPSSCIYSTFTSLFDVGFALLFFFSIFILMLELVQPLNTHMNINWTTIVLPPLCCRHYSCWWNARLHVRPVVLLFLFSSRRSGYFFFNSSCCFVFHFEVVYFGTDFFLYFFYDIVLIASSWIVFPALIFFNVE